MTKNVFKKYKQGKVKLLPVLGRIYAKLYYFDSLSLTLKRLYRHLLTTGLYPLSYILLLIPM